MVVLPADHLVEDGRGFLAAVRLAAVLARKGFLVTFGIPPTRPDTGYGYVQVGEKVVQRGRLAGHRVLGFREKPNPTTARRYVASGDYLWNSGMFVWRAADILEAFCRFLPDFHADLMRFSKSIGTSGQRAALNRLYRRAPSISIDYAVMEKAANVAAVRGRFDWDDVGSWLALDRHLVRDRRGNIVGTGCAVLGSERCLVQSDQGIVAVLACSDLVVVRSGDAVLVAHKDGLGEMKNLLADIRQMPGGMKYL
jgi:mannose-1-phosphate guanylyltransferase